MPPPTATPPHSAQPLSITTTLLSLVVLELVWRELWVDERGSGRVVVEEVIAALSESSFLDEMGKKKSSDIFVKERTVITYGKFYRINK
jgi:hypothetical protein